MKELTQEQVQQRERISGATVTVEVLQGRNLVAKDGIPEGIPRPGARFLPKGRLLPAAQSSSDPYVKVFTVSHQGKLLMRGKTKTCPKTLSPVWNDKKPFSWDLDAEQARDMVFPQEQQRSGELFLKIFDQDDMGQHDFMGVVRIRSIQEAAAVSADGHWFPVQVSVSDDPEHSSCKGATGELQIRVKLQVQEWWNISRGQECNLKQQRHQNIIAKLSWQHHHQQDTKKGSAVDLDASCVAVDREGNILLDESVYYANLHNTNHSLVHSGDQKTKNLKSGAVSGIFQQGTETISVRLGLISNHVMALYFVLTLARPFDKTLKDMESIAVHFTDSDTGMGFCQFLPASTDNDQALGDQDTAMCLLRIARANNSNDAWTLTPVAQGYSHARDFGALVPQLKSLTSDLVPGLVVDSNERMAILRKGGSIHLADYLNNPTSKEEPQVTLGLSWNVTNGANIDLDASALVLDADYQIIDQVFFKKLTSDDGSIRHSGDEREGDNRGDDEKITVHLSRVSPETKYICFLINSFSGQELDDVSSASCHLFDPIQKSQEQPKHHRHATTYGELAKYTMTNCRELNQHTALIMGILFRDTTGYKDSYSDNQDSAAWTFWIVSKPSMGKVARHCGPHLQEYLQTHSLPTPERIPVRSNDDEEIEIAVMPESFPVDEEIVFLSDEELDQMNSS